MTESRHIEWGVRGTGNHQGLIVDENSGKNIAVAYDKADAPLIAAAPELLEALQAVKDSLAGWMEIADDDDKRDYDIEAMNMAEAAIAKARGEN